MARVHFVFSFRLNRNFFYFFMRHRRPKKRNTKEKKNPLDYKFSSVVQRTKCSSFQFLHLPPLREVTPSCCRKYFFVCLMTEEKFDFCLLTHCLRRILRFVSFNLFRGMWKCALFDSAFGFIVNENYLCIKFVNWLEMN